MAVPVFTDTQLLDEMENGLCLWTQDLLTSEGWERTWYGAFDGKTVCGGTAREVIALAILDRTATGMQH